MIIITLHGCFEARCPSRGLKVERKRHGVVDVLARALVASGAPPSELVSVLRGTTLCFDVVPLQVWADRRLTESDTKGFSVCRWKPRDDFPTA